MTEFLGSARSRGHYAEVVPRQMEGSFISGRIGKLLLAASLHSLVKTDGRSHLHQKPDARVARAYFSTCLTSHSRCC